MIVLAVLTIALCVLLGNFVLMVVLGAISHIFNVPALSLGFWETMIVGIALSIVGGFFSGSVTVSR